jgi:hypothetical protein
VDGYDGGTAGSEDGTGVGDIVQNVFVSTFSEASERFQNECRCRARPRWYSTDGDAAGQESCFQVARVRGVSTDMAIDKTGGHQDSHDILSSGKV